MRWFVIVVVIVVEKCFMDWRVGERWVVFLARCWSCMMSSVNGAFGTGVGVFGTISVAGGWLSSSVSEEGVFGVKI